MPNCNASYHAGVDDDMQEDTPEVASPAGGATLSIDSSAMDASGADNADDKTTVVKELWGAGSPTS